MTGRYLTEVKKAFKEEGRALVGRRRETDPPVQPYYDDVRPPAQPYGGQSYGQPPATIDPAVLQALLQGAKAQGAYEALQASNDASADRIANLAMAAINRPNTPVEIRYRGAASDKKERRFAEIKAIFAGVGILLLLIFIWWVKDDWMPANGYASPGYAAHAPINQPNRPAHYKHTEEWDDR